MAKNLFQKFISVLVVFLLSSGNIHAIAVSANPNANCSAITTCSITFTSSGDYYAWAVPAGITSVTFDVRGAAGGASSSSYAGGTGGKVTGVLNVAGFSSLYIYVGGVGTSPSSSSDVTAAGGYNGGGNGAYDNSGQIQNGGAGGGASDIRTAIGDLNSRLVVAGGGGGGGNGVTGGNGGGTSGQQGNPVSGTAVGGGGGTQSAGGTALLTRGATAGSFGVGGQGGTALAWGSGGGGGGYYGGGGGSSGADHGAGYAAGGGGGSSYADSVKATTVVHTQGGNAGAGQIILTYLNAPPNVSISISGPVIKGQNATITFTTDQPGKVTFFASKKKIPNCINISSAVGNSTCLWKPSVQKPTEIYAVITQGSRSTSTTSFMVQVARRTGLR
jgi:hypothetical protein